jgi:hypothetical protein
VRLSWPEIKNRAKAFAEEWKDAHYERGQTQTFYNEFFEIFGVKRKQVASYEQRVKLLNNKHGFMDLLWPGTLLIEQKSARLDLRKAQGQALDYVDGLPERDQPKYVLTCDFQTWNLFDLENGTEFKFVLKELPKHIELFAFVLGRRRSFGTQAVVNIKAAELMGRLHDALEATGYTGHDLEKLLVRLLFCLFADDTGIFEPKDIFLQLVDIDTKVDGSDTGRMLSELFDVLDTPENKRQSGLAGELKAFPYINGDLFKGHVRTPVFDTTMREMLLDACRFDWGKVSPAIFGSLFQSVMNVEERRIKGAHYTSEENILKVIGPLFLDDLRAELDKLKLRKTGRDAVLREFQKKLARLTFLDPACGCGNFLVIAYRELRALELEVLEQVYPKALTGTGATGRQGFTDLGLLSLVTVDQFYGIEFEEFPARIAEVAMWMMDHIANNNLSTSFTTNYARIPLKDSAHIVHADALETDWATVIAPEKCSYIMGNPPFGGHQYRTSAQVRGMESVWGIRGQVNRLDYVTCWFKKSVQYGLKNKRIKIAFVSTNSISQGEQVGILWPQLFLDDIKIVFAHRTFIWTSEASGRAAVHCIIVGLAFEKPTIAHLYDYPSIKSQPNLVLVREINGYLVEGKPIAIPARTSAPFGLPDMYKGSQPTDGARLKDVKGGYITRSNLILDSAERRRLIESAPEAEKWLRPYVGGDELISGNWRWCLWLKDVPPKELRACIPIMQRLNRVKEGRLQSPTKSVKKFAKYPWLFTQDRQPNTMYIGLPEVSSENRDYIPMALLDSNVIASNKLQIIPLGTLFHFGILTSNMHMAWMRTISGRLKSDYSYSPTVYNTFPWPTITTVQKEKIQKLAQAVLDARAVHTTSSLADLYDPDIMPANLRKAHTALDLAVDKLYRSEPFVSDRDRVEHLFTRYEALVNPLEGSGIKANQRNARKAAKKTLF